MSIINQMLRDLDAREASEKERSGLPTQLRPLPPHRKSDSQKLSMLVLGVGIGVVLAGIVFFAMREEASPPASSSRPSAAADAIPPVPTASVSAPETAAPEKALPSQQASPVVGRELPAATPESVQRKSEADIKPISQAPAVKPVKPAPAEAAPKDTAKRIAAAQEASAETDGSGESRIDKRAKSGPGGKAHDLAEAEYRKGMQAVKLGDYGAAMQMFKRSLEFESGLTTARQALLSVLVRGKQWNEARQVAEEGLALDPTQSGWVAILARLQFEQGDTPAAIATLERYAAHAKGDADYQGLFAYLLQKQERPAEAVERFRVALGLRPYEGRWWFGLGLALESTGKASEAKEAYAKAREAGKLPPDMAAVIDQKLK